MDAVHGFSFRQKRILIPELDNLLIVTHNDSIYTSLDYKEEVTALREIEVPDELARKAYNYAKYTEKFQKLYEKFLGLQKV